MAVETLEERADPPRPVDPHRPSRVAFVLVLVVLVLLTGIVVGGVRYYRRCEGAGSSHAPVTVTIAEGATGEQVVQQLAEAGVIPCGGIVGRFLLRQNGNAGAILAGTYDLSTDMTLDQAITILTTPPKSVPTVTVTIPEGYRLTQIADRVQHDVGVPASRFLALAQGGSLTLAPYLPTRARSAEGFLFPSTYEFVKKDATADTVAQTMLDQFATEADGLQLEQGAARLGYSPYEVVTIASMIEEEARLQKDRPLVAAVIYNRLKLGMTLGIDATLLYDDPTPDGQLSSSDLQSTSPYNTRLHAGLPPTPIASPGAASLEAALHPADVGYLFYVLCGADGHHKFSSDFSTFQHDVATCLG